MKLENCRRKTDSFILLDGKSTQWPEGIIWNMAFTRGAATEQSDGFSDYDTG